MREPATHFTEKTVSRTVLGGNAHVERRPSHICHRPPLDPREIVFLSPAERGALSLPVNDAPADVEAPGWNQGGR